ncbi:hypothetical protein [Mycolicibacterium mageritense]|uniref:hypothetical protein n=1 Tax=Mycolicibacterium mageritense TaxID=53462 RepID=UPI001E3EBD7B|nr:hypothetical protein [Mycolicibacterium mageritense]GJJ22302.1 hypothetical protein MTY414_59750 [Mycolicibacterium mageritense]
MTEMTEAQATIAEALRAALKEQTWTHDAGPEDLTVDGPVDVFALAAEIDKALGGLTREERIVEGVFEMGVPEPAVRWVSGWSEVQS